MNFLALLVGTSMVIDATYGVQVPEERTRAQASGVFGLAILLLALATPHR